MPVHELAPLERQLRGARQHITGLPPMDEVLTLEQRHAGERAERGVDKIKRVPHPAHTGVGMIAGDDGIAQHLRFLRTACHGRHQRCKGKQKNEFAIHDQ